MEIKPRMFFIPVYLIILALAVYGKIENMYMVHIYLSAKINLLSCVICNILFLGCVLSAWWYIISHIPMFKRKSGIFLLLFLACYGAGIFFVGSQHKAVFTIPNFAPWVITWYDSEIPISLYHLILFVFGFTFLVLSLSIPFLANGKKEFAAALFCNLGAVLIGLVYQDWFWFVFHPSMNLKAGMRYGVFFNQWMKVLGFYVPAMYVVAQILGILMVAVPSLLLYRRRSVPHIVGLFGILAALILFGVFYVNFVKPS